MSNFPIRGELALYKQRARNELVDLGHLGHLRSSAEAERQRYFVDLYGQDLGGVAARFANLAILPPETEKVARQRLIDAVLAALESRGTSPVHPIDAVIEATELRAEQNYIPPEMRSDRTLMWIPDFSFDSDGNIVASSPEDELDL